MGDKEAVDANLDMRSNNWNRFSFEGSIKELTIETEVMYLRENIKMSLSRAFEWGMYNWEMGNSPTNMIYMVTPEYEGNLFVNPNVTEFELLPVENRLKLKHFGQGKPVDQTINWNRFDFNASIVDLKLDSEVRYLREKEMMTLAKAFEFAEDLWIFGKALTSLIFLVSYDFEGEIQLINDKIVLGINLMILDENHKVDRLKQLQFAIVHEFKRRNYDKTIELINGLKERSLDKPKRFELNLLCLGSKVQYRKGKNEKALKIIIEAEEFYNSMFNEKQKIELSNFRNDRNQENLNHWDNEIFDFDFAAILNLKGDILFFLNNFDFALKVYAESLSIRNTLTSKVDIEETLNCIGNTYLRIGDLDLALSYYNNSLVINRQLQNNKLIMQNHLNIGRIYQKKKLFNQAMKMFEKASAISIEIEESMTQLVIMDLIAINFRYQQNLVVTKKLLIQCFDIKKKKKFNESFISPTLYYLILICCELRNFEDAEYFLNELKKISDNTQYRYPIIQHKIAKAVYLLNQNIYDLDAKLLLEEVIDGDLINVEYSIFASLNLSKILLLQVTICNKDEFTIELNSRLSLMFEIAKRYGAHELSVKVLLIQTQRSIINENKKKAIILLNQAQSLCVQHNLENFDDEINILIKQIQTNDENLLEESIKLLNPEISFQFYILTL